MSLFSELIALDTNEYIFGLRRTYGYSACTTLIFEKLPELNLYVPSQVLSELRQNLADNEMRDVYTALDNAKSVQIDCIWYEASYKKPSWPQNGYSFAI